MNIKTLIIKNFRSHAAFKLVLDEKVTFLAGPNGAGKTNVLEAVYVAAKGRSFRDGDDSLIMYGARGWIVKTEGDNGTRELSYKPGRRPLKQLSINGVVRGNFSYKQRLPVVLFEPDDMLLIHNTPSSRRRHIDEIASWLYPGYATTLVRYERALSQRNSLLKNPSYTNDRLADAVFVWDIALVEYGQRVSEIRGEVVRRLGQDISKAYSTISGRKQDLVLKHISASPVKTGATLSALSGSLEEDRRRGYTTIGPHRDDVEFILNGRPAKETASRGEVRSIVLAMKKQELDLSRQAFAGKTIVLLDDVFSELDEIRQKLCLDIFCDTQIVITGTDFEDELVNNTQGLKVNILGNTKGI